MTENRRILVYLTNPEMLDRVGTAIELSVFFKFPPSKIAKIIGVRRTDVTGYLKKYKPKQGTMDITVTIMSKV